MRGGNNQWSFKCVAATIWSSSAKMRVVDLVPLMMPATLRRMGRLRKLRSPQFHKVVSVSRRWNRGPYVYIRVNPRRTEANT
jgi:hypothetical protein